MAPRESSQTLKIDKTQALPIIMSDEKKNPHAVALGRLGGKVTSKAKTKAARLNGAKGGRPKKDRLAKHGRS